MLFIDDVVLFIDDVVLFIDDVVFVAGSVVAYPGTKSKKKMKERKQYVCGWETKSVRQSSNGTIGACK